MFSCTVKKKKSQWGLCGFVFVTVKGYSNEGQNERKEMWLYHDSH